MKGLADKDGDRAGGGTRSSPWSEREGGALAEARHLEEFGEDVTEHGMDAIDPVTSKERSQPTISRVGFHEESHGSLDRDTDEDLFGDETVVSPVADAKTAKPVRPKPAARTARSPDDEPWKDVADAAAGPAERRFPDDPEGATKVPLTDRKPKTRSQTEVALDELRSWAENRRRSRSTTTGAKDATPRAPVENLPSFKAPPAQANRSARPKIRLTETDPLPDAPTLDDNPRAKRTAAAPQGRRTSPKRPPAAMDTDRGDLATRRTVPAPKPKPKPKRAAPIPPAPTAPNPVPPKPRPTPERRRAPDVELKNVPVPPPLHVEDSKETRRLPGLPTAEEAAAPPPPPPRSEPPGVVPRKPRADTRSLAVEREKLEPVVPQPLERQNAEETKLGQLAQPDADLLVDMPVMYGQDKPGAPGPSETIAAPGELAGVSGSMDRSHSGLVKDLDAPPSGSVDSPVLRSPSEVRRGLEAHLVTPEPPKKGDHLRHMNPERTAPEGDSHPLFDDASGVNDTKPSANVDALQDFGPEDTPSMLQPLDVRPVEARGATAAATGDLVAVAVPAVGADEDGSTESVHLTLATGLRRIGAATIDAVIVLALVAVPALVGVFGDAIGNASVFDPDDMSALLVGGELTLPLLLLIVLSFVYPAVAHTLGGRTLGKLALGLELVRTRTGERPSTLRSFLRALVGLLSLSLGGLGYFWLIVDRRGRALHDHLTATSVVVSSSRS